MPGVKMPFPRRAGQGPEGAPPAGGRGAMMEVGRRGRDAGGKVRTGLRIRTAGAPWRRGHPARMWGCSDAIIPPV